MPQLLVEKDGYVTTLTMNRPKRYNALTFTMFVLMDQAWREASDDPDCRVIILTGAGGNFCSGMDLRAMAGDADEEDPIDTSEMLKEDPGFIYRAILKTSRPTKPVIAAVGPLAVAAILRTLHDTPGMTEDEAFAYERTYADAVGRSADAKEGPRAFAEKRAANFQGK